MKHHITIRIIVDEDGLYRFIPSYGFDRSASYKRMDDLLAGVEYIFVGRGDTVEYEPSVSKAILDWEDGNITLEELEGSIK